LANLANFSGTGEMGNLAVDPGCVDVRPGPA
jgi:hypothetical protein